MARSFGLSCSLLVLAVTMGGCSPGVLTMMGDLAELAESIEDEEPAYDANVDLTAPAYEPIACDVTVNGKTLTEEDLFALGAQPGQVPPGNYWYDARAGLWGYVGGSVEGQVPPGLDLPALDPHVSQGDTSVIVNGREITRPELALLQQAAGGPVAPGRYFLDANGDAGMEGGPVLANLFPKQKPRRSGQEPRLERGIGFYDPGSGD